MINYSIIIPHRNSLELLRRCLGSIPSRDDTQIIVVDDNSDIEAVGFHQFPELNRSDVELYLTKAGKGAGYARNVGLSKATGKWVLFADADDFFVEHAFIMLDSSLDDSTDIHYYKATSIYSDTLQRATRHLGVNNMIDYAEENEWYIRVKHIVPWGKVFRLAYLREHDFRFDEVLASNDVMFGVQTGFFARKIVASEQELYCITMNSGSISNTLTPANNLSRYKVALRYNQFLKGKGLHHHQNSIRPFLANAVKIGLKEFIIYLKLMRKYNGSLFVNFNPWRSVQSYFRLRTERKKHKKYLIDK